MAFIKKTKSESFTPLTKEEVKDTKRRPLFDETFMPDKDQQDLQSDR
jgi:hypothetical protein